MALILGAVAGFLGTALRLGKCFAEPIKRQFNYLCCFNSNILNLRDEAQKLEDTRSGLQMKVDAEENNAQVVVPEVKTWFNKVDGIIQAKNTEIEAEITTFRQNGCFAVKSRFSLGKKVKKTAEDMKDLREEGSNFAIIAQPPPPAAVAAPITLGSNIFEFNSRKRIEEEIIVSLKDENVNKLGICGMGGVGKTTMAKRIMHRVRGEHLFDEIVMAVVSQKPDRLAIQGVIAKQLGLELRDKESVPCRALDLHARLTAGTKRSLIVLDDVWEVLNLEELGIPCDSGCKILLTSRDRNILKGMDVEKVAAVRVLSETEAWYLFKSKSGSCIKKNDINAVAQQVVNECKGLPIALVTVGVALKDTVDIRCWNHALDQLKSANPNHMSEVIEGVYKPLRFSYESLKSVDEKSLFLLCCLFPEDCNIRLEDLVIYAMGLCMFRDVRSLERARETVFFLVERLKSCFLLLKGEYGNRVKMHDVVRDVARFIASDERLINCDDDCTWIAPYTEERFGLHMGSAVYPNPHLLLIDNRSRDKKLEIGDDFFEGMGELNVFSIEDSSLRRLPKMTKLMENLKTLILDRCTSLESISVVGELVNLEILICRRCRLIKCLPIEMAGISRLRLLELRGCWNLKTIAPGIISNQKGLEELIVEYFDNWEAADEESRERKNASLSEFEHLSRLSRLEIKIKDPRVAAGHKGPSPNMVKYNIRIGDNGMYERRGFEKVMKLNLAGNISLGKWIHECVRSVEYMWLKGSDDSSLDFGAAYHMRSLTLEECSAVKKLVDMRSSSATVFPLLERLELKKLSELEVICHIDGPMQSNSFQNLKELRLIRLPALKHLWNSGISPNQQNVLSSFNKLSTIYIYKCHGLRSLFPLSVMARGSWFVQLESLEIRKCHMMEQVLLWNEEENQINIHIPLVFPKLKKLELLFLPRLTSFSKGIFQSIEFLLLEIMKVSNCPQLKGLVSSRSSDDHNDVSNIQFSSKESCVSTSTSRDDSMHLFCKPKVEFGNLKELSIGNYDSLRNWCGQISMDFFAVLCKLEVSSLKGMKSLFPCSIARNLRNLIKLEICDCEEMVKVIEDEEDDALQISLFPNLECLYLCHLEKLKCFCKWRCTLQLPKLEHLDIRGCDVMEEFTLGALNTPNLYTIYIDKKYSGNEVNKALQQRRLKTEVKGSKFTIIAQPRPPAAVAAPIPIGSNIEFDSRKQIEEKIIVSLKDEIVNKLGICGMGGVGKTTMAKRIMHRVREEHLFDEMVMAVVGQKPDRFLAIQGVIAKKLGLELKDKGSVECRAVDLHARLTAGTKRSLIVLDDVWDVLNLEELGIPCHSGCKILLISRDRDILKRMDVEKVFAVRVLSETEAWYLFKSKAGSCIEQGNDITTVAQQVVNECKGLPIALVTVGVALKDAVDIRRWNHALDQLKSANPNHMSEVIEDVYKPLRFSYGSLKSVDEKSLFLLCCLFPEDYNIHLEDLAMYATGLRMFRDVRSLERVGETVFFLVERLKSCFLLLEGYSENHVKMHDVVRDVARFIASDERLINCDDCTWIAPYTEQRFGLHMGSAVYPNPHLLLINNNWSRDKELEIGDDFFEGMGELNVFSIRKSSLRRLPKTTKLMKNLKTLILVKCRSLESISVVGELVNLEILICRRCELIECLPIEMAGISRLRLLELSGCWRLKTIAPGIISNQKGLEELIVEDFDNWEAADEESRERKNASVSELEQLSRLSRLKIKIKDCRVAAGHKGPSPNMVKYDITIGNEMYLYKSEGFEKVMMLNFPGNISLGKWIHECVRSVEYMWLKGLDDSSLDFGAAHNMRSLTLEECSAVKKLVNMSSSATVFPLLERLSLSELSELEVICDIDGPIQSNSFQNLKELRLIRLPAIKHLWNSGISPNQQNVLSSFNKLSTIYISECHGLRSLFSLSVMERGSWFVQLESLEIWECDMMEQVLLWNEEENQTNIHIPLVFPKLKKLELCFLPRLTSFSKGTFQSVEFPLLEDMTVWNCPLQSFVFNTCSTRSPYDDDSRHLFGELDKVKFGSLKVVRLKELDKGRNSNSCPQISIDIFNELCQLTLPGFKSLKSLFSLSMTESSSLLQLEELEIEKCDMMEQVLRWNGEESQRNNGITLQFPKLKLLKLSHMPMLTSFSKGIFQSIEFPLLEKMEVQNCPLLKGLVSSASSDDHDDVSNIQFFSKVKFDRLTKLVVGESVEMGRNWHRFPIDLFTGLCKLRVSGMKEMKNLFSLPMTQSCCLLQLEKLQISNCEIMEQIILWNEDEENQRNIRIIPFPKLKLLILDSLPRLTSFCKGIKSIVEFSLPEKLKIRNCPVLLESCVSTPISPTGPSHDDDVSMHLFCSPNKVQFDRLTKLVVGESVEMGRNWHRFPIDLFAGLCKLRVSGFKEMKNLFSLPMTQSGCLLQLEKLQISNCEIMEQIILWNEDEENQRNIRIIPFPKLKLLILDSLPKLTSFCKGIKSIVEFSLPEKLKIHNCPVLLEGCVSTSISPTRPSHDDDDSMHLFCSPNKVEFVNLKELSIGNYDSMRNWCGQISIDFFAVLCELKVSSLKGMKSLFPCSIARNLQNLVWLRIHDCEEMVKVIEDEEDDALQISLFPNLKRVELFYLKKLESFCEWRCTLQLPELEHLHIEDCDVMDEFTLGDLNTPNLKTILIDWHDSGNEVNKALQQRRLKREKQLETRLEESSSAGGDSTN